MGGAGAYDINNDEKISRDEAQAAIADYYSGAVARDTAIAVTDLHKAALSALLTAAAC